MKNTSADSPQTTPSKDSPLTRKVKYAAFNIRLFAILVDMVIVMSVGYPFCQWLDGKLFAPMDVRTFLMVYQNPLPPAEFRAQLWQAVRDTHLIERTIITNGIQGLMMGLYILPCWFRYNTTFGKRIMGIEIRDAKTMEFMTRRQMVIRFLAYIPSCLPFALGFIWSLFNKKHQAVHDKIAGTVVVVKERKPFSLSLRSASQ